MELFKQKSTQSSVIVSEFLNLFKKDELKPKYPNFKFVKIEDKKLLDDFNKNFPVYSDFLFENLVNWGIGTTRESEFCFLNDNLVVRFRNNEANGKIISMLGKSKLNKSFKELLNFEKELNYVPEGIIKFLNKKEFEIKEDRNNSDYVIKISKLIDEDDKPLIKKKKISEKRKKYPDLIMKDLDLSDKKTQSEILNLFEKWKDNKKVELDDSAKCEYDSIKRFFNYYHTQEYMAFGVYDETKLIGFNIGIKTHGENILGIFSKADNSYRNLFVYMVYIFAVKARKMGCTSINMDVDLGKEGLRESKMSWGADLHKKYSVIAR